MRVIRRLHAVLLLGEGLKIHFDPLSVIDGRLLLLELMRGEGISVNCRHHHLLLLLLLLVEVVHLLLGAELIHVVSHSII